MFLVKMEGALNIKKKRNVSVEGLLLSIELPRPVSSYCFSLHVPGWVTRPGYLTLDIRNSGYPSPRTQTHSGPLLVVRGMISIRDLTEGKVDLPF